MLHGGKRAGAGKPKGVKWKRTLRKEQARELVRQQVTAELGPIIDAHIANSKGISHFILRDKKTGKFERVTDPNRMVAAMNEEGGDSWEIWERDPNIQSAIELLNRALDRNKEQPQDLNIKTTVDVVEVLKQRHERHRASTR